MRKAKKGKNTYGVRQYGEDAFYITCGADTVRFFRGWVACGWVHLLGRRKVGAAKSNGFTIFLAMKSFLRYNIKTIRKKG